MSARSPFRSHLLQQWTSSRRSPIVVQQWLRQATIDENEEDMPTSFPTQLRRSMHKSSHQFASSLSSVDSSPSSTSISMTAKTPGAMSSESYNKIEANQVEKKSSRAGFSAVFPFDSERSPKVQSQDKIIANGRQKDGDLQKIMLGCKLLQPPIQATDALHEMAMHRNSTKNEYATPSVNNLIYETSNFTDPPALTSIEESNNQRKIGREIQLTKAINRAVLFAKNSDVRNHHRSTAKQEQPFTFRKLLSSSRSGRKLIDICFQVTSRTTGDEVLARKEQKRWSEVPAFLFAIVHDNQEEPALASTGTKKDEKNNHNYYKAHDYSPPIKEQQLEDYASACAAVQSVIHALEKDGFTSEWISDSIIKTPALRTLAKAMPTDRIAALILVHKDFVTK